ncbi:uncharacterized protein [Diabrotica undecimpunctata]|uniref:uncharacterized protein n=1 Tax=Diabrotica undecimpunctata TaxID=50387 RepID=UPI003B63ED1D
MAKPTSSAAMPKQTSGGYKRKMLAITHALDKLDDISTRKKTAPTKDSFDIFGEYVAATLKKLPPPMAAEAEMNIHHVLHKIKVQALQAPPSTHPVNVNLETSTLGSSSSRLSNYNQSDISDISRSDSSLHEFLLFDE